MPTIPRLLQSAARIPFPGAWLWAAGIFSVAPINLRATDDKRAALGQAHDLLMKAHDETDPGQRISDLKAADQYIEQANKVIGH